MDKNDPLTECSITILNSLQRYKNNITELNNQIVEQKKDKNILEENINLMEEESEKIKMELEAL